MISNWDNILWDLDGTVTDPYEGITNSILFSLKYYPNIPTPKREELREFIGPPLAAKYAEFFALSEEEAKQAVEHYREYYRPYGLYQNKLYDGIEELLAKLKHNGKKVYLATSKPEEFAKKILVHYDIDKYFDGVYGSTLDGSIVKKEDVIKYILDNEGCNTEKTVMIGDTQYDIIGAHKLGLDAVGVTYGYGRREDIENSAPCAIVDSVEELEKLLFS